MGETDEPPLRSVKSNVSTLGLGPSITDNTHLSTSPPPTSHGNAVPIRDASNTTLAEKHVDAMHECDWVVEDPENGRDYNYCNQDKQHIPQERKHELEDLLHKLLANLEPGPANVRGSYVLDVEPIVISQGQRKRVSVTYNPDTLQNLVIGSLVSPLNVPVLLLPGASAPSMRVLRGLPAMDGEAAQAERNPERLTVNNPPDVLVALQSERAPIDLTQDTDTNSELDSDSDSDSSLDADSVTLVSRADHVMDLAN